MREKNTELGLNVNRGPVWQAVSVAVVEILEIHKLSFKFPQAAASSISWKQS